MADSQNPTLVQYTSLANGWFAEGEDHKVDVGVVRSVYGVQVATQANQSVFATSTKFTKDARDFAKEQNI